MLARAVHLADNAGSAHDRKAGLHPVGRALIDGDRLAPRLVGIADDARSHTVDLVEVLEIEQFLETLSLLLVLVGLAQQLAQLGVALAQTRERALVGREVAETLGGIVHARACSRADELQRRNCAGHAALDRVQRAVLAFARVQRDQRKRGYEKCDEQNSAQKHRASLLEIKRHR